jgi:hypothetical protein
MKGPGTFCVRISQEHPTRGVLREEKVLCRRTKAGTKKFGERWVIAWHIAARKLCIDGLRIPHSVWVLGDDPSREWAFARNGAVATVAYGDMFFGKFPLTWRADFSSEAHRAALVFLFCRKYAAESSGLAALPMEIVVMICAIVLDSSFDVSAWSELCERTGFSVCQP